MLQTLLPGIREIRPALSAGYVWLIGIWLLVRRMADVNWRPGDFFSDVATLAQWGKPAVLVATGFIAYLVGVISVALGSWLNRAGGVLLRSPLKKLAPGYWTTEYD